MPPAATAALLQQDTISIDNHAVDPPPQPNQLTNLKLSIMPPHEQHQPTAPPLFTTSTAPIPRSTYFHISVSTPGNEFDTSDFDSCSESETGKPAGPPYLNFKPENRRPAQPGESDESDSEGSVEWNESGLPGISEATWADAYTSGHMAASFTGSSLQAEFSQKPSPSSKIARENNTESKRTQNLNRSVGGTSGSLNSFQHCNSAATLVAQPSNSALRLSVSKYSSSPVDTSIQTSASPGMSRQFSVDSRSTHHMADDERIDDDDDNSSNDDHITEEEIRTEQPRRAPSASLGGLTIPSLESRGSHLDPVLSFLDKACSSPAKSTPTLSLTTPTISHNPTTPSISHPTPSVNWPRVITKDEVKKIRRSSVMSERAVSPPLGKGMDEEDRLILEIQKRLDALDELDKRKEEEEEAAKLTRKASRRNSFFSGFSVSSTSSDVGEQPPSSPNASPMAEGAATSSTPILTPPSSPPSTTTREPRAPFSLLSIFTRAFGGSVPKTHTSHLAPPSLHFRSASHTPGLQTRVPYHSNAAAHLLASRSVSESSYRTSTTSTAAAANKRLSMSSLPSQHHHPHRLHSKLSTPSSFPHRTSIDTLHSTTTTTTTTTPPTPSPHPTPEPFLPPCPTPTRLRLREALHLFDLGALQASTSTFAQLASDSPLAQYAHATCLMYGLGTPRSVSKALGGLENAARGGEVLAMVALGEYYLRLSEGGCTSNEEETEDEEEEEEEEEGDGWESGSLVRNGRESVISFSGSHSNRHNGKVLSRGKMQQQAVGGDLKEAAMRWFQMAADLGHLEYFDVY
ncbi:hypothetical protein HDV05_004474 [Chytridiales sp. JEL 0842]|nr:hypothetical protein HDV05_004474 [Chytridiales sp. JEL 0842]